MRKILTRLGAAVLAAASALAAAAAIGAPAPSGAADALPWDQPAYWSRFDWSAAERQAWWTATPAGEDFDSPRKQIYEDTDKAAGPVGARQVAFAGGSAKLILYRPHKPGGPHIVRLEGSPDDGDSRCDEIAAALQGRYGDGVFLDMSQKMSADTMLNARVRQWHVGPTAITLKCAGLTGPDRHTALTFVDFEPFATVLVIKPALNLHCQGANDRGFDLIVQETGAKVLNADRVVLDRAPVIAPDRIAFKVTGQSGRTQTVTIDRKTGALDAASNEGAHAAMTCASGGKAAPF